MNTPVTREETTTKERGACSHRDMAGDSAICAINDHTWCGICGMAGPDLGSEKGNGDT